MRRLNPRLFAVTLLGLAFIYFQIISGSAQTTIWNDTAGDTLWTTSGNWSSGSPATIGSGAIVQIGTLPAGGIAIDTGGQAIISSLTFNNSLTGSSIIGAAGPETLQVNGGITNSSTFSQDLVLPVFAGANATFAGGTGLNFSSLTVGANTILTTGTVTVSGGLIFNVNSNTAGGFGTIGNITASNTTTVSIAPTSYETNATLASNRGDFFKLTSGNFSGATAGSLAAFNDPQLTWVSSLIPKGILFVAPSATAATNPSTTYINSGVVLPIGNDTEFNGTGTAIILNGGQLLTSDNGALDTGGTLGAAFSTSRAISVSAASGLAATAGTTATYSGAITGGGGLLTIGDATNTGTVTLTSTSNTYSGGTTVAGGTLAVANSSGSATGTGAVTLNSGTKLQGTAGSSISGQVNLSGNNTISSAGTTTVGSLSVSGTGNQLTTGTFTGNTTFTGAAALADNGVLNGTLTLGTGTLSGNGSVTGATTLNGGVINFSSGGNIGSTLGVTGGSWNGQGSVTGAVTSSSGTFTIGNGANLTANGGLKITGGTIAAGNSASTITGNVDYTSVSTSVYAGAIAGIGKTVTLNNSSASFTLSGTNTYTGATTITAGKLIVTGSAANSAFSVANGATLAGFGTVGAVNVAGGGNINMRDNNIGTLTVAGLTSGQSGTPSTFWFDINTTSGTTTVDKIVDTGTLTFNGTAGTSIVIGNLGANNSLVNGSYTILSYTGTALADLSGVSLTTTTLDGKNLSLFNNTASDLLQLVVANAAAGTTYNLTTTATNPRIMSGQSTALTTTISNTGGSSSDTLNYTGLGANATGVTGATTNGGPVGNSGGTSSNTSQTFSSTTVGAHTINPTVATAVNATVGGNSTLGTTTGTTVDVLNPRTYSATTVNLGRSIVGQNSASLTTTITSATGQDTSLTRTTLAAGSQVATGVTNGTVTLGAGSAYQFGGVNDATNQTSRGVTGNFTTAGTQSGTAKITPTGEGLTGESVNTVNIAYTADPVNKRAITNGVTKDLGTLHNGATVNATSTAFSSLTSHLLATDVSVASGGGFGSKDANNIYLVNGGATNLDGVTTSGTRTFNGTISGSGTTTGSFNLAVSSLENSGAGLTGEGTYSSVAVAYTANVYSGQGVWAGTGTGGSWGTLASGFGSNWGANQGSPGLDSNFASSDTATFNNVTAQATQLVSLNGASPSLNSITFNAASTSYTLAQGSGGTVTFNGGAGSATLTDTAGNHTISAPMSLATNTNVGVASGQTITLSGPISGAGGITTTGAGTTVLSGTSTFSGAINDNAGKLNIIGSTLSTGNVSVGNGAILSGRGSTGRVTVAGGGQINLQDGVIGTLTVGGMNLGSTGTPSVLSFDIGSGTLDKIVDTGALSLNVSNSNLTTINIGNVSGTPTLTNGQYTLISSTGLSGSLANLNLATTVLDGKLLSLSIVGNSIALNVANLNNAYTLSATADQSRLMVNTGSTTVTSTITNVGAPGTVSYTGLDATLSGTGTLSGGTLPKNGGPLNPGVSDSGTSAYTAGNTTGQVTITPIAGGVTGSQGVPSRAGTTPAVIDVVDNRIVTANSPASFGRIMTNVAVSKTVTLSTTGDDSHNTRVRVGTAGPDANGISATGGLNPVFNSAAVTDTRTVGGTFTTAGNITNGSLTLTTTGEGLTGEAPVDVTINYTADAVNKRVITNGAVTDFGTVHSGTSVSTTSNAFTTTGDNATTTSVTVAGGGSGVTDTNGVTISGAATTFDGSTPTASGTQTLAGTLNGVGTVSGTFNLAVNTLENGGAGLVGEGTYSSVSVAYTSFVYSGQGLWNTNGSGSWGTVSATPANWMANGGTPGLDANFTTTDTATFGNVLTSGTATVSLNGDNPSLKMVTFNNTLGAGYAIAQGSGGTLKLNNGTGMAVIYDAAGNNAISAPIEMDSDVAAIVANAYTLTLSGSLSDNGAAKKLILNGPGTIVLSGANSYTGGTTLQSGTLQITGAGTLGASGSALTVNGGMIDLGGTTQNLGAVNITNATTIQNGGLNAISYTISAGSGQVTMNASLAGGALNKSGGSVLALNGANSYTGGTTITGGTVAVGNASALGVGDVNFSGGVLTTSAGTNQINVQGNYTQSGGTLVLDLTGTTPGANPGYKYLNVSGTATLGGALQVIVASPYVPTVGDSFQFIQAGDVTGHFDSATSNLYSLSIDLLGNGIIISQVPLATLPGVTYTPNQQAIAQNIDTSYKSGASSAGFQSLLGSLNSLTATGSSPDALPDAFNQLSPEKFANFTRSTVFNNATFSTQLFDSYLNGQHSPDGNFLTSTDTVDASGLTLVDSTMDPGLSQISSHLLAWSPAPIGHGLLSDTADPVLAGIDAKELREIPPEDNAPRLNTFILGNAVLAQNFSQSDLAHSDSTTGAVQLGASYRVTPHLRVGATFGYGHTDSDLDNNGSKATVDGYAPGVYASYADKGWYANAIANYGFNSFTEDRHVSFGGLDGIAHGAPSGSQVVANLDGGYDFHVKHWTFGPTSGLQYTHLQVDSFTENGFDPVDLQVNEQQSDSLRSKLGGHVSYTWQYGKLVLTPHLDASWQHEFLDQSRGITSQFASIGVGSFSVNTPNPSRESALIDCGLTADLNGQVSVYLDYLAQVGQSDYFGQAVQGGVKVGF